MTLDAHHDLRDGVSNGSPVQRLINAGFDGRRIVQIGIADFANSVAYAQRAADYGITVIGLDDARRRRAAADVMAEAVEVAGSGGSGGSDGGIHLDVDVDVCDRSVAPGCPASVPGGLAAWELRALARAAASDSRARVAPTSSRWTPPPTPPTGAPCGSPRCACSNCSQDWGHAHDPTGTGATREVGLGTTRDSTITTAR